jgi:tyrosine decarboxylase
MFYFYKVKNKYSLTKALSVDPIYLRYKEMDKAIDYRHWGIALSRRFRSLKLWFTLRTYGIEGIQKYIREHVRLARLFETYVLSDNRFEICAKVTLGLVCFRLKGPNILSQNLLFNLNDSGQIHMVPSVLKDKYVIRFCVNAPNQNENDMLVAWNLIREEANQVLKKYESESNVELKSKPTEETLTSEMKRMRFGVSRVVSDPHIYKQRKYKRTPTSFRFVSDSGKYITRKCSIIETNDEEEFP